MDKTKNFKSIHIHNGCRSAKVNPVKIVPKRKWVDSIVIVATRKIKHRINENLSLMDAETQKGLFYGKEYFNTFQHASFKLTIALNDVIIEIHMSLLKSFVYLTKKLKMHE